LGAEAGLVQGIHRTAVGFSFLRAGVRQKFAYAGGLPTQRQSKACLWGSGGGGPHPQQSASHTEHLGVGQLFWPLAEVPGC
jgi:hypothetical protein